MASDHSSTVPDIGDDKSPSAFLGSTEFLDTTHPRLSSFARAAVRGAESDADLVACLFRAVRDGIRYNPYAIRADRRSYRASQIAQSGENWCVPKAVLLVAAARSVGIPARLGFADVRNHISTPKLRDLMGTDLFVYHGYAELFVTGRWFKASPAFNSELCARFGVSPLEFDGTKDALLHAYDGSGQRYMEYVHDHGWYPDLPFDDILAALESAYRWTTWPTASDAGFQPS